MESIRQLFMELLKNFTKRMERNIKLIYEKLQDLQNEKLNKISLGQMQLSFYIQKQIYQV